MIKLTDDWVIDSDKYQYILGQPYQIKNKDGTTTNTLKNCSYFDSISKCLNKLLQIKQKELVESQNLSLKATISEFEKLQKEFENLLLDTLKEGLSDNHPRIKTQEEEE